MNVVRVRPRPFVMRIGLAVALAVTSLVIGTTSRTLATASDEPGSMRPLISRTPGQELGIWWAELAGNGRTAFAWTQADVVGVDVPPGDGYRLFAIDVVSGATWLVTADRRFQPEAVSRDGRLVVGNYELSRNGEHVVAVVDAFTGEMRMIDVGVPLVYVREIDISADGTTLAIAATTMVDGAITPNRLFLIDIATGAASEPLAGADGDLFHIHLSRDGTVVAFSSYAENLAMPVGNRGSDPVVYDRVSGTLSLALTTIDGDVPDDQGIVVGLSDDGQTVLIRSGATNLDERNPEGDRALYSFDRPSGTLTPIELNGLEPGWSVAGVSADATVIAVAEQSSPLALTVDLQQGTALGLYPEGVQPDGPLWNGDLHPISLDATGTIAVLVSTASNLGPDADGETDAFIVGAPPIDPAADIFVPPARPLPPDPIDVELVQPPALSEPEPTPTTTAPVRPPAPPAPTFTPDDTAQPRSTPISSIHDLQCRLAHAIGGWRVPCTGWGFGSPTQAFASITGWIALSAVPWP